MANHETEMVLGWSLEELKSINLLEACYPNPDYRQQVMNCMMAADPGWTDFKTTTRTGEIVETSWANVRLSGGMSLGIGQDITARKQAEKELRQSEETFKAIVEYVPTMINSFDENGQPTIWNKALVESCGYTFKDAKELNVLEKSYADKTMIEQIVADLAAKSGVFKEYCPRAKDGKQLAHEWDVFGLPDG